jgi:hypothetical protein
MQERSERGRPAERDQRSKRKYEAPEIRSQETFETTALKCGKVSGGGPCGTKPKVS